MAPQAARSHSPPRLKDICSYASSTSFAPASSNVFCQQTEGLLSGLQRVPKRRAAPGESPGTQQNKNTTLPAERECQAAAEAFVGLRDDFWRPKEIVVERIGTNKSHSRAKRTAHRKHKQHGLGVRD